MPRLSLQALRQIAPERDRNDRALALPDHKRRDQYQPRHNVRLTPRTPDELREMAGEFGEAAVSELGWTAIGHWLMQGYPAIDGLRHPWSLANDAVRIAHEQERYRLGWPRHDGAEPVPPALDGLTADYLRSAKLIAADTIADWKAASKPYTDARRIGVIYQYLTSCPAFRASRQGNQ